MEYIQLNIKCQKYNIHVIKVYVSYERDKLFPLDY